MATVGQFSSKNPTIKRIHKEAAELAHQPSADYHAAPLETDIFEWHFTIRGPPSPSPFDGGVYHGRIVLPPAYPLKPPSFRFLTPTGRFEVNREICLSISGHHEETWQPAWGIRTALVAIRSFMDTDAKGQLGGMDASEEARKRWAGQSKGWKCGVCGKTNEALMAEQEEAVNDAGVTKAEETVPDELRLAYREDLGTKTGDKAAQGAGVVADTPPPGAQAPPTGISNTIQTASTAPPPLQAPRPQQQQPQPQQGRPNEFVPAWIDKAIYGIIAALVFLIGKKLGTWNT